MDEKKGIDIKQTPTELQVRFVVTQQLWPFAKVDNRAVWDKAEGAFRVDLLTGEVRRVIATSDRNEEVLIWPRAKPIGRRGELLSRLGLN